MLQCKHVTLKGKVAEVLDLILVKPWWSV